MIQKFRNAAILTLFLTMTSTAIAYEVDQFTRRDEVPKDSTALLDKEILERIKRAVDDSNSGFFNSKCDGDDQARSESRLKLFGNLRDYLVTSNPIGLVESSAEKNKAIDKRKIALSDSIYSDAKNHSEILKKFGIASVISVNGTQIGTDKLGHFFNEGYTYYLSNYKQKDEQQKRKSIVLGSQEDENGMYGIATTKIKSYADIATNYEGSKFWNKLCGWPSEKLSDSEKEYMKKHRCRPDAYLKCENGEWKFNEKETFTLKDYVNPAWDESINCSSFAEEISESVFNKMSQRVYTYKGNPKQPCPAEPQKCVDIIERYRGMRGGVVNPICAGVADKLRAGKPVDPSTKFSYTYDVYNKKAVREKKAEPTGEAAKKSKRAN